jgi:hypothetical protein
MAKVAKDGQSKTLYIEISLSPCGAADPTKNLTSPCPTKDTQFKTTLSDEGLKKLKKMMLAFYSQYILKKAT